MAYKPKARGTVEAAIDAVIEALGAEHCANVIGRNKFYIYGCADPDQPDKALKALEAIQLDLAMIAAGHQPVITITINAIVRQGNGTRVTPDPMEHARRALLELERLMESIHHLSEASPGEALKILNACDRVACDIRDVLLPRPKIGARPQLREVGGGA